MKPPWQHRYWKHGAGGCTHWGIYQKNEVHHETHTSLVNTQERQALKNNLLPRHLSLQVPFSPPCLEPHTPTPSQPYLQLSTQPSVKKKREELPNWKAFHLFSLSNNKIKGISNQHPKKGIWDSLHNDSWTSEMTLETPMRERVKCLGNWRY